MFFPQRPQPYKDLQDVASRPSHVTSAAGKHPSLQEAPSCAPAWESCPPSGTQPESTVQRGGSPPAPAGPRCWSHAGTQGLRQARPPRASRPHQEAPTSPSSAQQAWAARGTLWGQSVLLQERGASWGPWIPRLFQLKLGKTASSLPLRRTLGRTSPQKWRLTGLQRLPGRPESGSHEP